MNRTSRAHCGWRTGGLRARGGFILLEVLAALTILAAGAGAVLALAQQVGHSVRHAQARDAAVGSASAFMAFVSLWPREDLDRHLGERPESAWRLRVQRPEPELYAVTLVDTSSDQVLIHTELYRPANPSTEIANGLR